MAARLKNLKKKTAARPDPKPAGPLYFYGVSAGKKSVKIAAIGVDNTHAVEALPVSGLTCWVTRVSPGFVRNLESRMEDLEWLAEASVLHQRAVATISASTELLPSRFGTVFVSDASLAKHLAARKKEIQAAFQRVTGAEEWGVKVFVTAPATAGGAAFSAASGQDYLRQKAKALAVTARSKGPDAETEQLIAALKKLSRAVAPTGKVSGAQPGLQWQASFLLPKAKRKQWDAVLKDFAQRWGDSRRIECTGPWPPYSFVE